MLRVILSEMEARAVRSACRPEGMLAEQTKPLVARIEDVTFSVEDVTLELITRSLARPHRVRPGVDGLASTLPV